MSNLDKKFLQLVEIAKKLRCPDEGCPWDREQTPETLVAHFREEADEMVSAIDKKDWQNLKEELGDVLLHIILQCNIAEEKGRFNLSEMLDEINAKLIRRHPHVFGGKKASSPKEAIANWNAIKKQEKEKKKRSSN